MPGEAGAPAWQVIGVGDCRWAFPAGRQPLSASPRDQLCLQQRLGFFGVSRSVLVFYKDEGRRRLI